MGLDRVLPTTVTRLERAPSDYLRHNVYYTFSGFNWIPQFLEVLLQVGVDRMMCLHRSSAPVDDRGHGNSRWFTAHAAWP